MPTSNRVTLFSNGIGHFQRSYEAPAKGQHRVSIPFKNDSIGDVASSLMVYGKVKIATPASFKPANADATSLKINQKSALLSLCQQLSGAEIQIHRRAASAELVCMKLIGVDADTSVYDGMKTINHYVVGLTTKGIRRINFSEIEHIEFTEESVQAEINKALQENFQKIRPGSTLLELTVESKENTPQEFFIHYTVPVASWKMRYTISEYNNKFLLDGAAIIDNNTDEDWNNFNVSVVTGQPITFSTDIAEVLVPQRGRVSLIEGQSLDHVLVSNESQMLRPKSVVRTNNLRSATMSYSGRSFGLESAGEPIMAAAAMMEDGGAWEAAESSGMDSKEVGDFSIFSCKDEISIAARRSAVVPMFSQELKKAGIVLFYKESNHARRPYRAVKFQNETGSSLGKGAVSVYHDGVFSGNAVMETCKPWEHRTLPHCLENGVRIIKQKSQVEQKRSVIQIVKGHGNIDWVKTVSTVYEVENKKDEEFKVVLEHETTFDNTKNSVSVTCEDLQFEAPEKFEKSYRSYFTLGKKQHVYITVIEKLIERSQTILSADTSQHWLLSNIIQVSNPLADDPEIEKCAAILKQMDEAQEEINTLNQEQRDLDQKSNRVRQNLAAVSGKNDTWAIELEKIETKLDSIKADIQGRLRLQMKNLQQKLEAQLKATTLSWNDAYCHGPTKMT